MKFYAGIGSRMTPAEVLAYMEGLAGRLRNEGWWLRSGHAPGADQAFERGAGPVAQVYTPWPFFESGVRMVADELYANPTPEAHEHAAAYHPHWYSLKPGAKKLMARNSHQVLGYDLRTPVRFLVCWTPGARGEGGTGQAIRIARDLGIPVFDLAVERYPLDLIHTAVLGWESL